jgi:hypothetical protein
MGKFRSVGEVAGTDRSPASSIIISSLHMYSVVSSFPMCMLVIGICRPEGEQGVGHPTGNRSRWVRSCRGCI